MYPHLHAKLFGVPLLIDPSKADVLASVISAFTSGAQDDLPHFEALTRTAIHSGASRVAPEGHQVTADGIAVIPILGTLVQRTGGMDAASGLTSYQSIGAQLAAAESDPGVRGIVLDIDSPGGEVAGAFELATRIASASKPVFAHANEMAASAAYLLGSASKTLNVANTGMVGSVGVVMLHVDQSVRDAKQGMKYTPIFAGQRKVDFDSHTPLSSDARAIAQARVDHLGTLFADTVAARRGITTAQVKATEAGMFGAADAVAKKLADGVGTLQTTIRQLSADLASPTRTSRSTPSSSQGTSAMPAISSATSYAASAASHDYSDAEIRTRVERIFGSHHSRGLERMALQLVTTSGTIQSAIECLQIAKGGSPSAKTPIDAAEIFRRRNAECGHGNADTANTSLRTAPVTTFNSIADRAYAARNAHR